MADSDTSSQVSWQQQAAAAAEAQSGGLGPYSEQTLRSLALIDQQLLNYDLIEALVCQVGGPAAAVSHAASCDAAVLVAAVCQVGWLQNMVLSSDMVLSWLQNMVLSSDMVQHMCTQSCCCHAHQPEHGAASWHCCQLLASALLPAACLSTAASCLPQHC